MLMTLFLSMATMVLLLLVLHLMMYELRRMLNLDVIPCVSKYGIIGIVVVLE